MIEAAELDHLTTLDRDLLHVFVAGPGQGEGIAVALPGGGWILVDGCTTGVDSRGIPLESIVTRWRTDVTEPVLAMVLTHRHRDHVGGFAELVEAFNPGIIALAGAGPGEPELLKLIRPELEHVRTTGERIRAGSVLGAFRAIDRWAEDHPGKLLSLHDGVALPVTPSPASVRVRAPDRLGLEAFLSAPNLPKRLKDDANDISIVLEVEYQKARLVLTGDLPRYRTGSTKRVDTGWDQVMPRHPHLGEHAILKIPHHGSAHATHPDLMPKGGGQERAWCVTPYNSSRLRLPSVADMDGLPSLLDLQPSILLTGVPTSRKVQDSETHPGVVKLAQLVSRVKQQPTGRPFIDADGIDVTPGSRRPA